MAKIISLDVYLCNEYIGCLKQGEQGKLSFQYDASYLNRDSATPLSISLPLDVTVFNDKVVRPYFSGLLPDGDARKIIAKNLGVSASNPFSLLHEIGGDCAGAVTLLPAGEKLTINTEAKFHHLTEPQLATAIGQLPRQPLLANNDDMRLSLAGVQSKMAVYVERDKIGFAYGVPTTHILKPSMPNFEDTVYNEFFCMLLAKRLGLHVANVSIGIAENQAYLLVTRYDRQHDNSGVVRRIHQEDFCQTLSVPPELKYEREGGPSVKQCLQLIEQYSEQPAIDQLSFIRCLIFNYLIGNADAHGKNFSFLYHDGCTILAPYYDLLSTAVYPEIDVKMAMKIGGKYKPNDVQLRHWLRVLPDTAVARNNIEEALTQITNDLPEHSRQLQQMLEQEDKQSPIYAGIHRIIETRCQRIQGYL